MATEWFFEQNGDRQGPVTSGQLRALVEQGSIRRETLLWRDGMAEWTAASSVKGLFVEDALLSAPPNAESADAAPPAPDAPFVTPPAPSWPPPSGVGSAAAVHPAIRLWRRHRSLMFRVAGVVVALLGAAAGLAFHAAGRKFAASGERLSSLRSVSGTTVAESYYQEMGAHGLAYAGLCNAAGLAAFMAGLGIGCLLVRNSIDRDE
jgi:hypothetical protein